MVTLYDMPYRYLRMTIIPIVDDVDEYEEYTKDLFYVDYCNNCNDLEVMYPGEVPCHHPWYCWHDDGVVQDLEFRLNSLQVKDSLVASEREELFKLKQRKYDLVKEKLRDFRRR